MLIGRVNFMSKKVTIMAEQNGKELASRIQNNIQKVLVGKEEVTELLLTALIADGHVLLEDVPGTGKTKLAKALAKSLNAQFSRVQFTPDLLPGDITGINVYDRQKNEFTLRKGPVFTNILLADELNRATPRTQAGLLECNHRGCLLYTGRTLLCHCHRESHRKCRRISSAGSAVRPFPYKTVHEPSHQRRGTEDSGIVHGGRSPEKPDCRGLSGGTSGCPGRGCEDFCSSLHPGIYGTDCRSHQTGRRYSGRRQSQRNPWAFTLCQGLCLSAGTFLCDPG